MIKFRVLLFPMLLSLSCTTFAQVYKSTDAEGNVTFSDTPSTDSEAVQVEETNLADPVEVPANAAPAPAPEVTQQEAPLQPTPEPAVESDDDDNYYVRPRAVRRHHHLRHDHRRR